MGRFHLIPRDERFVPRFEAAANNLVEAADTLLESMSKCTEVQAAADRMEELEHTGDQLTHSIVEAANRAFVTPFDREDIVQLAGAIDDVLDDAEEAARRRQTYRLEHPTPIALALSRVLARQCRVIGASIALLDDLSHAEALRQNLVELHRLENEADERLNEALGSLYVGVTEVPALIAAIQWGDIYSLLERATDRAENVAVTLETIVVKRA